MIISKAEAASLLVEYSKDKILSVTFIKRTTGQLRTLTGRKGVTKGITGQGLSFDPQSKGLLVLFDITKDQFRMVNLETICRIKMDGQVYQVE